MNINPNRKEKNKTKQKKDLDFFFFCHIPYLTHFLCTNTLRHVYIYNILFPINEQQDISLYNFTFLARL